MVTGWPHVHVFIYDSPRDFKENLRAAWHGFASSEMNREIRRVPIPFISTWEEVQHHQPGWKHFFLHSLFPKIKGMHFFF